MDVHAGAGGGRRAAVFVVLYDNVMAALRIFIQSAQMACKYLQHHHYLICVHVHRLLVGADKRWPSQWLGWSLSMNFRQLQRLVPTTPLKLLFPWCGRPQLWWLIIKRIGRHLICVAHYRTLKDTSQLKSNIRTCRNKNNHNFSHKNDKKSNKLHSWTVDAMN